MNFFSRESREFFTKKIVLCLGEIFWGERRWGGKGKISKAFKGTGREVREGRRKREKGGKKRRFMVDYFVFSRYISKKLPGLTEAKKSVYTSFNILNFLL